MYQIILLSLAALTLSPQTPAPPARPPQMAQSEETRPEDLCTMEGKVVSASTGSAVGKASLTMRPADTASGLGATAVTFTTSSDETGHFAMKDLPPGRYFVSVRRSGYVGMEHGAKRPSGPGTMLTLEKGARLAGIDFKMTPQGVISGRVVDEHGEPTPAQVTVSRYGYSQGKRQLTAVSSGFSDDLGEYRVFGLAPGRYLVSASAQQSGYGNLVDRSAKPRPDVEYVRTFYPSTPDPSAAVAVDVTAGAVTSNLQLKLMITPTFHVSGHATQSLVAGRPAAFNVSLILKSGDPSTRVQSRHGGPVDPKGGFEIRGVSAGRYDLYLIAIMDGQQRALRTPAEVSGDVENLNVTIGPGLTLSGSFRVEGETTQSLKTLRMSLRPKDAAMTFMQSMKFQLKDDLTFTLEGVDPDIYDVTVPLPAGLYLKSMRCGDADVLLSGLDLAHGMHEPLQIVLGANPGQITGTVQNPGSDRPVPGATVALVPQDKARRGLTIYYANSTTDQNGRFTFRNLAPGDYKVFAWDDVENTAWLDADFLKPVEAKGEPVTVHESGREDVRVQLIPAGEPGKQN